MNYSWPDSASQTQQYCRLLFTSHSKGEKCTPGFESSYREDDNKSGGLWGWERQRRASSCLSSPHSGSLGYSVTRSHSGERRVTETDPKCNSIPQLCFVSNPVPADRLIRCFHIQLYSSWNRSARDRRNEWCCVEDSREQQLSLRCKQRRETQLMPLFSIYPVPMWPSCITNIWIMMFSPAKGGAPSLKSNTMFYLLFSEGVGILEDLKAMFCSPLRAQNTPTEGRRKLNRQSSTASVINEETQDIHWDPWYFKVRLFLNNNKKKK